MDLVGLVLGNSTQRRVDHPACARVLAMHRGVGGVLGPFTCGFRAGEDGERVGVSEAGVAAAGKVSRAARWQRLSAERLDCSDVLHARLSPGLDNSTGNSTATRQATRQVARQLLDRTPLTPCDGGVKCQARQLDRPRQTSTDLIRTRQTSTEPSRYGPAC